MRWPIIPVLLLAAVSFVASIGRGAIADSDEAFYAEAAREMVESGDWLTPHFNYELRFQKPILYYWLTAALDVVTGPTEGSSRLWSALSGIGLVFVVAACGRRWFDESTGLLAGAIAATSFGYFALARMALPDLPFTFFTTLSIWTAFVATLERERHPRRWLLLSAAAAALGFLTKGPLALVLPAIVVAPILLIERRSFNLRMADLLSAVTLFAIIAAPWYAAMWMTHGAEYLRGFFVGDNYERFATTRFNDPRPWWFYLPVLAGGLLPWTPLTLLWLKPLRAFLARRQDIGAIEVRLLLWAALPLLFFTVSVGKQPRYVLPILPPVALLLASSIVKRTNAWLSRDGLRRRPRPDRLVVAGCALGAVVLLLFAGLIYRARVLFLNVSPVTATAVVSITAVAAIGVLVLGFSRAWRAAPAGLAVATAVAFASLPYAVLPASSDATVRQMADMVRAAHTGNEVIGTYRVLVRNLVFYSGIVHTDIINDDHLREWVATHGRALVVMPSDDAERLEKLSWLTLERLGALPYFDDGSLRVGTLLWPDPTNDLETVVLARVTRR